MKRLLLLPMLYAAAVFGKEVKVPEVVIDPSGLTPHLLRQIDKAEKALVKQAVLNDALEIERLRRKAQDIVVTILQRDGYYNARVILEVGQDFEGEYWQFSVTPNKPSKVKTNRHAFVGQIQSDQFKARRHELLSSWKLPSKEVFVNERWSSAKAALLDDIRAKDFFLANYAYTQAYVDPSNQTVDTDLVLHSGPQVFLGDLQVEGLSRVPKWVIQYYVDYLSGKRVYSREALLDWQQQLQRTGLFRGVSIVPVYPDLSSVDGDIQPTQGLSKLDTLMQEETNTYVQQNPLMNQSRVTLPLKVQVSEAPARSVQAAVSIDDQVYLKGELLYKQNVIFGLPWHIETGVSLDFKRQKAFYDVYFLPSKNGGRNKVGVLLDRHKFDKDTLYRASMGWQFSYDYEWSLQNSYRLNLGSLLSLDYVFKTKKNYMATPTWINYADITYRKMNDYYNPTSGYMIKVAGAIGFNLSKWGVFSKLDIKAQYWYPMSPSDTLILKGAIGGVVHTKSGDVPIDFGYRLGGNQSIRGFGFQQIAETKDNRLVGADFMWFGSVEYQHYFNEKYGMSLFADVGDAKHRIQSMKPHLGVGAGFLYKTPIGAIDVSLAWGIGNKWPKLHFSLGVNF